MYNPNLHFHFVGIGGAGMSGIAEILLNLGFRVSGSDLRAGEVCLRLERLGAKIRRGHAAEHLPADCSLVVYSSAVVDSNPELAEARRRGLPVVRRAEVLAELMRLKYGVAVAGSHGKTTTTSMTAAVLEEGGLDPTVIIGGQLKAKDSGSRLGKSDYLVAETDESDRSFLLLKPTVAVVTNIDAEHMTAYSSFADLEESFARFVDAVPFYGLAVLCCDDLKVRALADRYQRRQVRYGLALDAEIRAENIVCGKWCTEYDVLRCGEKIARIRLPLPGRHLMLNSLAAIAVGLEFGVPVPRIVSALESFSGVQRRLEQVGQPHGIPVISDYAHHPTEVKASLRAVREGWGDELGRLHVIFEPHRYSRTRDCFVEFLEAFVDCDRLILTEIYSAGEEALEGVSGRSLCDAIARPKPLFAPEYDAALALLLQEVRPGDVVVCMGAGSIGAFAHKAAAAIAALDLGTANAAARASSEMAA